MRKRQVVVQSEAKDLLVPWKSRSFASLWTTLVTPLALLAIIAAGEPCIAQDGSASLLKRLPLLLDSAGIPGLAIGMLHRGEISSTRAFGVADVTSRRAVTVNTVFEAASLSKPVVAYAAMKLVDSRRLDLDRPLAEYMALEGTRDPRAKLITARMVLSHTTGLQNERMGQDTLAFAFAPGTQFQYSGEAVTYLGQVLEHIARVPFNRLMDSLVFGPLGMTRSSFIWEDRFGDDAAIGHGAFQELRTPNRPTVARGAATLHTTVLDYSRFLQAIVRGTGLPPETRRIMASPQVTVAPGIAWALGWSVERGSEGDMLWHHGDNSRSGFTAFAIADPQTGNGLVYFTNSTAGLGIVREVLGSLGGTHPSADWIHYERYDAPGRLVRVALERVAVSAGAADALQEYERLRLSSPVSAFTEGLLNTLGYRMLQLGKANDAVVFFQKNVAVYPQSSNAFDSLGDGLVATGDIPRAIASYRRSLTLDPKNTHAVAEIARLADKNASP